jgi:lysophospholipase L1-like esterase
MKKVAISVLIFLAAACDSGSSNGSTGPTETGADFTKYVAMGTSISMGVASDGVVSGLQQTSWPKLLANSLNVSFSLPLIASPGCPSPIISPLGLLRRADGTSVLATSTCSANSAGVSLPTQNLAIAGATSVDATTTTGAAGGLTSRVLPAGQTQVTAMRAQNPTFVSVEFGSNEILPALTGLVSTGVTIIPFSTFSTNYKAIIDNVKQTGAKAVLVTLPDDVVKFPALRTSAEIASQRTAFSLLGVSVNSNCNTSANFITIQKLLTVMTAAGIGTSVDLSCADVPGTADGVLTPADITTLNGLVAQMNSFILAQAAANGYATFSLGTVYDNAKSGVGFDLASILTVPSPFGAKISLDAVHPSEDGQDVLAAAAKAAIIAKYGSTK